MSSGSAQNQISVIARGAVNGGSVAEGLFLFFAGSPSPLTTSPSKIVAVNDSPVENTSITFNGTSPVFPYHAMNNNLSIVFVAKTMGVTGSSEGIFFASLDQEGDGVPDAIDNCPMANNPTQTNTDQARYSAGYAVIPDTKGDACDDDQDGDSLVNYPPGGPGGPGIEPNLSCNVLPDCDGDGYLDNLEQTNCITVKNYWTVGTGDTDCDGYADTTTFSPRASESTIGTVPSAKCSTDSTFNNESLPDAWPPDFNDNQLVNGADILSFNAPFGKHPSTDPPVTLLGTPTPVARWDLNGNNIVNGADILQLNPFFGKRCFP
jgi:hypothetical protein